MGTNPDRIFPDNSVALCTRCVAPHDPLLHYCPRCGEAVGQFTPNIPFVNIRFQADFFGSAWRKIWAVDTKTMVRVLCVFTITLLAPILLVALPRVIWQALHARHRDFDVEPSAEQASASPNPDGPPERPSFSDRPVIPH